MAAREKKQKELGEKYPAWVLDQLHTQIMLANRIAMGRGLEPPRFRWVPYDDALMYPLDNTVMEDTPDRKFFYSREEMLLKRYLGDLKLSAAPATLDEYLKRVVTPTLESQKKAGAVAVCSPGVPLQTQLICTKTGPSSVAAGELATYTVVVTNQGTATATGVIL